MATLSADDLAYLRDIIGDEISEEYGLSDLTLQTTYAATTQGNGDLGYTIVYALRRLLGRARRNVSLSGEFGGAAHNQIFEQLERLLAYWEGKTGLAGGRLTTGVLNLHLDYTDDDLEADALSS